MSDWTIERDEDGEPARMRWTPETPVEVLIDVLPVLIERLHMEVQAFHKGWSTDMRRKGRCGAPNKCQHADLERLIERAEQVISIQSKIDEIRERNEERRAFANEPTRNSVEAAYEMEAVEDIDALLENIFQPECPNCSETPNSSEGN